MARARASYEPGLLLCSVANTPLFGIGVRSQVTGAEALTVRSDLALFPLRVCSPPTPALAPLSQRRAVLEPEGLVLVLGLGLGTAVVVLVAARVPDCF